MALYATIVEARHRIYELYQLDWLMSHGYALMDVVRGCAEEAVIATFEECQNTPNATEVYDIDPLERIEDGIRSWSSDGFGGSRWVCYDEFLCTEYCDVSYVGELVKRESRNANVLMGVYLDDLNDGVPYISDD